MVDRIKKHHRIKETKLEREKCLELPSGLKRP